MEARLQGRESVADRGIRCLRDLLAFDHRAFWRNFKLVAFDRRRLGQRVQGRRLGSAPRAARTGNFTYDHDQRAAVTYSYEPNIGRPTATTTAVRLRRYKKSSYGLAQQMDNTAFLP